MNEKCNFNVVLSVTADGGKCKPLLIFKPKTMSKVVFPKEVVVTQNKNGLMDTSMITYWLENISFSCQKSVLIYDSARPYITDEVKGKVKKNPHLAIIPGDLTFILKPLDLSVNKSFSFTKSGS